MSLVGDVNSDFKVAYADGIAELVPEEGKLQKLIEFAPVKNRNGLNYQQPLSLTQESGFTYSATTQDAFSLNDSVGMEMQTATVPGWNIVLASTLSYETAARGNGVNRFKGSFGLKMKNVAEAITKRTDIGLLYGQDCIAQAALQLVATVNPLPIVIDTASWATGIWTGATNQKVVFSVASSGAVVDSLGNYNVARVDVANRTVYFSAGTGSLAALETAIEAAALKIHFFGSVSNSSGFISYNEMYGMKSILTNTGTLFGVSASTYDLWKGQTYGAGSAQLNQSKVNKAVNMAVQSGLQGDVTLLVNPSTWSDLMSNQAAQRVFDSSYDGKEGKNGTKNVKFFSQNGTIEVVSYNLVKEGDAFLFPVDKTLRIGAQDISFGNPARPSEDIFFDLPTQAGIGFRSFTNQALFIEAPAQCVYISGIVNGS